MKTHPLILYPTTKVIALGLGEHTRPRVFSPAPSPVGLRTLRTISSTALLWAALLLPGYGTAAAPTQTQPGPPGLFPSSPIFDAEAAIPERLTAVARLGQDLTPAQISALYAFLKALPGPHERNLAALNLLKNNLVSRLQDQAQPPAGLTDTLVEVCRNSAQDQVARDYALQHLITWYEQGAPDAPNAKFKIQSLLRQAAQEKTTIVGTALLGLHRLNPQTAALPAEGRLLSSASALSASGLSQFPASGATDDETISQTALQILASADSPCASRITAIQVCAERSVAQALPAIQALALSPDTTALRVSAVAALGWLGGPDQAALLHQLEAEQNPALKPAVEAALRRLHTRLLKNPVLTQISL